MRMEEIKLKDYYTQRENNPDGRSLALYQYKYEYESIFKEGIEYKISARYIGNGYFFIHFSNGEYSTQDFFDENEDIERVHEISFERLIAFKEKKRNAILV